jgi:hypothetical protein
MSCDAAVMLRRRVRRVSLAVLWCGCWLLAAWTIKSSVERGRVLQRTAPEIYLGAAPLVGRNFRDGWDWRFGWALVGAGVVAALVAAGCVAGWWWRLRLRWVVAISAVGTGVFATLLSLTDGADGLLYSVKHPSEYSAGLDTFAPAGEFLRTFIDRIDGYSVHVRGHPPGFVMLLKAMAAVGLGGAWPEALLSVFATVVLVGAVLVTVHSIAGHEWVRRCAPFLVVAPYAIWMITSADAVYTAMGAVGIALAAVGVHRHGRPAVLFGLSSGLVLGLLLFMTYLAAVAILVPVVVVAAGLRHRDAGTWRVAGGAAAGAAVVTAAFFLAGFWWFEGMARTRIEYWDGSAQFRVWSYFGLANVAAALFALGPVTVAGLLHIRDRRMWLLVGAGVAALVVSHLSQFTRGEVERIWLLFYPWIALAAGTLAPPLRRWTPAALVVLQAGCAITLQAALVTKW